MNEPIKRAPIFRISSQTIYSIVPNCNLNLGSGELTVGKITTSGNIVLLAGKEIDFGDRLVIYADTNNTVLRSGSTGFILQNDNNTADLITVANSGLVTVHNAIAINNPVTAGVGIASTHKVTISIGGSVYYLLASNV